MPLASEGVGGDLGRPQSVGQRTMGHQEDVSFRMPLASEGVGGDLWRPQSVRQRTMEHQEVPHTISDEKRFLLRIQNDINPKKS